MLYIKTKIIFFFYFRVGSDHYRQFIKLIYHCLCKVNDHTFPCKVSVSCQSVTQSKHTKAQYSRVSIAGSITNFLILYILIVIRPFHHRHCNPGHCQWWTWAGGNDHGFYTCVVGHDTSENENIIYK